MRGRSFMRVPSVRFWDRIPISGRSLSKRGAFDAAQLPTAQQGSASCRRHDSSKRSRLMDTLFQDIRYATRKLARTPGFTFIAVATLALAIGATTSIFSIVNGVLLKPLPFSNPDRLVFVASVNREGKTNPMSTLDFIDYRDQSKSFVGMAAFDRSPMSLTSNSAQPVRLQAAQVGATFFDLLGVKAERGRTFAKSEDAKDAAHVVVLSDATWRNRFGADERLIGQEIRLDG